MADDNARRNLPSLSLHVPEPRFRPGDAADFNHFDIPAAGDSARPPIDAAPDSMRGHSYGLVRVLDDDARAVGPWDPRLSPDRLLRMLRHMALTRAFDERMYRAQRQGKTSFYMKCTGEEGTCIPATHALDRGDMVFPSYRQQGVLIARGLAAGRHDVPDLFQCGRSAEGPADADHVFREGSGLLLDIG